MKTIVLLLLAAAAISITGSTGVAFAQEAGASNGDSMKLLGAGLAFGIAAGGAGIGLGQVGAAQHAQAQAELDATRQGARTAAYEPLERLGFFGQGVTGLMGGYP